jgi:heme-degrading monooxygenase HmoA
MVTENVAQGHTTVDEEEVAVVMNWQSEESNNNGSDNSGSYESTEDELGSLLHKMGAQKGSHERDPNYILEEEVW